MDRKAACAIALTLFLIVALTMASGAHPSESDLISEPSQGRAEEARILEHRMTLNEMEKLKRQIGASEESRDYNLIIDGHGTGLSPPSEEAWQKIANQAYIVDRILPSYASQSPNSVDLTTTPWFPPIGDQDGEGSCTTWAVGYYTKTFQEAKEHGWDLSGAQWEVPFPGEPTPAYQDRIMSPDFIYHLINGGVDQGSTFEDAIGLVCDLGASSWLTMPYDPLDHSSWPYDEAWEEAPWYRGNSSGIEYLSLATDYDLTSLKNWLASYNLAVIGVDAHWYPYLTDDDVWTLDNYNTLYINHASTVVGYNDSIQYTEAGQLRSGAFKIANSWGKGSWENVYDGCYWISYEAMKQRVGYCMFYRDRIGYKPELVSSFRVQHAKRGECDVLIGMGTHTAPVVTKSFSALINGGAYPFLVHNIVFDITEFKDAAPTVYGQPYFFRVYDGGSITTGSILNFSVCANALTGVSENTPVSTVNGAYVFADAVLPNMINVPFHYSRIQDAVNSIVLGLDSNPRVTIQVAHGTYREHVVVNKTVSLVGEDRRDTIIDGGGSGFVVTVEEGNNDLFIEQFTIRNGSRGFSVSSSSNITIRGNSAEFNQVGIYLDSVSNSAVFHNNFAHNVEHVSTLNAVGCVWDNGYPSGGNYWSDYGGADSFRGISQDEANSDGIGDTSHFIDTGIADNYPLMKPYGGLHDIGVLSVNSSRNLIGQGCNLTIRVRMVNYGISAETFNLTAYANTTMIQTQIITLTSRNSTTLEFVWDTKSVVYGNYSISAYATPVLDETDTSDNILTQNAVTITIQGDANGDRKVNSLDIGTLNAHWAPASGTPPWSLGYDPDVDCNDDGYINSLDIGVVNSYWGQAW